MMISISVVTIKLKLYISRFSLLYTYAVSLLVVILYIYYINPITNNHFTRQSTVALIRLIKSLKGD